MLCISPVTTGLVGYALGCEDVNIGVLLQQNADRNLLWLIEAAEPLDRSQQLSPRNVKIAYHALFHAEDRDTPSLAVYPEPQHGYDNPHFALCTPS